MAGFTPQQQAIMQAVIQHALNAAGSEAAANLAEWQVEMQQLVQTASNEKDAMKQQMLIFHAEAEAMKAILAKSAEDGDNLKRNLAKMQNDRDIVIADLSAKAELVGPLLEQLKAATSDAMVQVRQAYGGIEDETRSKFGFAEQRMYQSEQKIVDLHARTTRLESTRGSSAQTS